MIQRLLLFALPLLLPFVLYALYVWALRKAGRNPQTEDAKLRPYAWLAASGVALMLGSLLFFRFYIDPGLTSRPDRQGTGEPHKRSGFPSEYGSDR